MLKRTCFGIWSLCVVACATASSPARDAVAPQSSPCEAIAAQWPDTVRRTEDIMRAKDVATFHAGMVQVSAWLDAQPLAQCPQWAEAFALQRATVAEYTGLFTIMHDADDGEAGKVTYGGQTVTQLMRSYNEMHDDACVDATGHLTASWNAWRSQDANVALGSRLQRYITNMERDEFLVRPDGSLGAPASMADFQALVRTPVVPTLSAHFDSLQGQGPLLAPAADAYVGAALHYAERNHIGRVTFVNTAGGQVPSFASQVAQGEQHVGGVHAQYIEYDGWKDGTLVTPEKAATFAEHVADRLSADTTQSALLVVNCNAGMDRSGTVNVLTQLILQARLDLANGVAHDVIAQRGYAAIPSIVRSIKLARPRAISSPGRFVFIYQAYAAYLQHLH